MALTTWNIDTSHSTVGFSVRHLVIAKVHGKFVKWSGALKLDEGKLEASLPSVEIETASVDTGDTKRDEHLRSADFFDAGSHPKITFVSKAIEKSGTDTFKVNGDLTIRGVTKGVVLDVEYNGRKKDPWGNERVGFSGKTAVNRMDFGLKWNQALEAGGVLVSEKVEISFDLEAVKAA